MPIFKTRDINGNYIEVNTETGKHTTTLKAEQSTSIKKKDKWKPKLLTLKQKNNIKQREIYKATRDQGEYNDLDMIKDYEAKLNFYNNNALGYGIVGKLTNFDPRTEYGRLNIDLNLLYAKDNLSTIAEIGITTALGGATLGILPKGTINLGKVDDYLPYKMGEGAEAMVFRNSPTRVGKIGTIGKTEAHIRNRIPNSEPLRFEGFVESEGVNVPVTTLRTLRTITEKAYPKVIKKLDRAMEKYGFKKFEYPDLLYRAYTNGRVIVDDVSPDNIGLTLTGKPRLIDFNVFSKPLWMEMFAY